MDTIQNKIEEKFADANVLDKKIPQDLLMKYQNKWYILKAGLEWKANYLFGGNNYGVTTEIVERSPDYVLAKATLKTKDGIEFSNFGEASKANVTNLQMHKYMLHLAVTRAECRVLRMATACGYTSIEEMDQGGEVEEKQIPTSPDDQKEPTAQQIATINGIIQHQGLDKIEPLKTQAEAKAWIVEHLKGKV